MATDKPQERLIHIKAESNLFCVSELIPESRVVDRLIDIRDGWRKRMWGSSKFGDDKLSVKTCVHNPTLF